jgi:hypothetical protein
MKTLILDGSLAGDRIGSFSAATLQADIAKRGWSSEVVLLREKKIGNCMGDFLCWFKSPGKWLTTISRYRGNSLKAILLFSSRRLRLAVILLRSKKWLIT